MSRNGDDGPRTYGPYNTVIVEITNDGRQPTTVMDVSIKYIGASGPHATWSTVGGDERFTSSKRFPVVIRAGEVFTATALDEEREARVRAVVIDARGNEIVAA